MRSIVFATALLIFFSVPGIAADLNGVSGIYLNHRDETEFLTLRPDATFTLKQRKMPPDRDDPFVEFSGKYQLNGETLTLLPSDGGTAEGKLQGGVFTDGQGDAWAKKNTEPQNVVRPKHKKIF